MVLLQAQVKHGCRANDLLRMLFQAFRRCDSDIIRTARFFAWDGSHVFRPQDGDPLDFHVVNSNVRAGRVFELRNPFFGKKSSATVVLPRQIGMPALPSKVELLVMKTRSKLPKTAEAPSGYVAVTNRFGLPIGLRMCNLDPRHPHVAIRLQTPFSWGLGVEVVVDAVICTLSKRKTAAPQLSEKIVGASENEAARSVRDTIRPIVRGVKQAIENGSQSLTPAEVALLAAFGATKHVPMTKEIADAKSAEERELVFRSALQEALKFIVRQAAFINGPTLLVARISALLRSCACPIQLPRRPKSKRQIGEGPDPRDIQAKEFYETERPTMEEVVRVFDDDRSWESFASEAFPCALLVGTKKIPDVWQAQTESQLVLLRAWKDAIKTVVRVIKLGEVMSDIIPAGFSSIKGFYSIDELEKYAISGIMVCPDRRLETFGVYSRRTRPRPFQPTKIVPLPGAS